MRTLIIGFDAFDPARFERLADEGRLPNLSRFMQSGAYRRFGVTDPPQSEVSWTSIATGLEPGDHGMFDFVHRHPESYALNVSLLPTKAGVGGTRFVPPFNANTLFDEAAEQGYPATALWWPALFPAKPTTLAAVIPGLGTPDLLGRWGVGTLFCADESRADALDKISMVTLASQRDGTYTGALLGPMRKKRGSIQPSACPISFEKIDDKQVRVRAGKAQHILTLGEWGPMMTAVFPLGRLLRMRGNTRLLLTSMQPLTVYALPLQLHPLHSPWPYGAPRRFVKTLWREAGPFLTVGWPQDTTAFEEACLSPQQFNALCTLIRADRERALFSRLAHFDEGVLACVFDSLDRIQHMFWADRPDIIDSWYEAYDALLGRVLAQVRGKARVIVVSDHGFAPFNHKVHLNKWLQRQGYLATRSNAPDISWRDIDWSRTQAYAVGLNSIYLNLQGREGQGSVAEADKVALLAKIEAELLAWRGADGEAVVSGVGVHRGRFAAQGADLIVGYAVGFRGSAETAMGNSGDQPIQANHDQWRGDHCIDARHVPGVILANEGLGDYATPTYRDFPVLAIGCNPKNEGTAPPPTALSNEDEDAIEARLKSLGYL